MTSIIDTTTMNSQTAAMNERQQMNESVVFLTAEMLELSSKGNNMILPISLNNYFVVSGGRDSICNSFLLTDQLLLQERRNKRRKKRFNNQTNIYSNNTCNNNTCMNNHNNSNSSGSYYGTPIKRTTSALTSTTLSSSLLLETNPSHSNDNISSNTSTTTTPTIINNDNNDNSITNSSERMLTPTREKRVRFQEGTSTANNNNSNNSRTASPVVATTTTSILKTSPRSGSTVTNSTTTTTNGSIETKNGNKVEITTTTINNNNLSMECKSNKKEERNGKEIGSTNTNNNNNNEKSLLIANKPTRSKSSSFDERKIPSNVNDLKSVEIPIRHASTSTLPTSVATTKGTTSKLINLKETKSCMHTSKSVGDCSSCALLTDDFDCGCACDYNISNHNAKDSFCLNKRKRQHYQLKIAVVGPENSGKSALIKQYLTHTFLEFHDNTIQDNYSKIIAKTDKEVVELYITDTAGSEEYSCLRDSYIKENLIFVCVLDVTDEKSLDKLKIILEEILNKKRETIPILLVANKVDKKERVITKQQIKKFMWNDLKLKFNLSAYLETSAKNNFHVDKLFDKVLQLMDNYNCFFNSDNNQFQFSSIHFNNHNHHYTTQEDETNSECSDIDDELVNNWMVKKKKEEDVNSKKELLVSSASNLSKWLGQSFLKRSKSIGSNLFKLNK